ncbi:MAG: hypothetical protein QNJ88_12020 [Acidimicrobiia bacterium]|nr:hypothetical protein [Acidimicrobiia bacterium]
MRGAPRAHREVAVGIGVAIMLVAAAVSAAATSRSPDVHKPIVIAESPQLSSLTDGHRLYRARYGIYVDLRDLTSDATLVVPVAHPLDPALLRSIAGLEVAIEDYDPDLGARVVTNPGWDDGRVGSFEPAAHRGSFLHYRIHGDVGDHDRIQVWIADDVVIVRPAVAGVQG